jgi:hypothetical protein
MKLSSKLFEINIFQILTRQPILLVSFVFILYVIKNIFLVFNIIHFDVFILCLALIMHIFMIYLFYKKDKDDIIMSLIICYLIIGLSLFISSLVYDYSWDGHAYHQPAVIFLKNGWNPFYASLPEELIWSNHFPKFTWIYGSIFTGIFKNIEVGKSYNILFLIIVFLYALKFVSKYQKKIFPIICISLFFTANPVALAQIFTYYVDGLMGMLIIILFFALNDFENKKEYKYLFVVLAVSCFAINIKFTGFVCGIVLIGYIIRQVILKNYKNMTILIITGVVILIVGVLFTGYNPYITNFREQGHPFWPVYGNNNKNIMLPQTPDYLQTQNSVQRFFTLFLLDIRDMKNIPFNPLKIFNITHYASYGQRIGGFGMFFIEIIFFVLLLVFITIRASGWKIYKKLFFPLFLLLFISIVFPENWWARYIPYFWYIPCFLIVPIRINKKNIPLWFLLIYVSINNGAFFAGNILAGYIHTVNTNKFLLEIDNSKSQNIVIVTERDFDYFLYSLNEKMNYYNIEPFPKLRLKGQNTELS